MLKKLFTTLVLIVTLLFQNLFVFPVPHAEDVRLKAILISDIHADADFKRDRTDSMRQVFAAIGRTQRDADTVVMSGDLTNSGDLREYINLNNCLNLYCRIRDRVPEMGNHDSWHHSDDPDYKKAARYFRWFCRWNRVKTDTVYYAKRVNGIPFLVLGVEDGDFGEPYHSDAQLDWFARELDAAVAEKLPVFVICHKPPEDLGDSAARVERILRAAARNAAAPILYVSGHTHADLSDRTVTRDGDRLVYLNLPSVLFTRNDGDEDYHAGLGYIAEVTDRAVTLTAMDFMTDQAQTAYSCTVEY